MRVLLVRPGRRKQAITLGEFMYAEPIGLECVATLLQPEHQVGILDLMAAREDFRQTLKDWQPEAIGFTALCIDVPAVLELAALAKEILPAVVTLVGGTQTYLAPENFFSPHLDYIVRCTTAENVPALFAALAAGMEPPLLAGILARSRGYLDSGAECHNQMIPPDREATRPYRQGYSYFGYRPCALLQTAAGCSRRCSFCLRRIIEGGRERDRPLDEVLAEIREIREPSIMILDNDFLHSRHRVLEFCRRLAAAGIRKNFICYASVAGILQLGPDLPRLAASGFKAFLVGYESFREADLTLYGKAASPESNLQAAALLKGAGIDCWASFILHPDWSKEDFAAFRRAIRRLRPEISSLIPLTPFPGSQLWPEYRDRVLFQPEDFDQWSFSLVSVRPGRMSLRAYYLEVVVTNIYVNLCLNSLPGMVRRFGWATLWRLTAGSLRFIGRYLQLMRKG